MHPITRLNSFAITLFVFLFAFSSNNINGQGFKGYYQYPTISGETIYFSAEGDIWKVTLDGGLAQRLTSHAGEESYPRISPDGKTLAFSASYEGPTEVYTMPVSGGFQQDGHMRQMLQLLPAGLPGERLFITTNAYSTLPDAQTVKINPKTKIYSRVPLSQASESCFNEKGNEIYFVRPAYHGNVTKRYMGGTARKIWKYSDGAKGSNTAIG